jgi:hypothetical protein
MRGAQIATRGRRLVPKGRAQLVALAVLLGVTLGSARPIGNAAIVLHDVSIRVYDNTGLAESSRRTGLSVASEVFSRAEVEIGWIHCPARCGRPLGPKQLILRLTRSPATEQSLGSSLIDPALQAGRMATVYVDQVDRMARRSHQARVTILGRAIAHEVGHLLLGTAEHTRGGLMREVWTTEELQRNQPDDWQFTLLQRSVLRARMATGDPFRWNAGVRPPAGRIGG